MPQWPGDLLCRQSGLSVRRTSTLPSLHHPAFFSIIQLSVQHPHRPSTHPFHSAIYQATTKSEASQPPLAQGCACARYGPPHDRRMRGVLGERHPRPRWGTLSTVCQNAVTVIQPSARWVQLCFAQALGLKSSAIPERSLRSSWAPKACRICHCIFWATGHRAGIPIANIHTGAQTTQWRHRQRPGVLLRRLRRLTTAVGLTHILFRDRYF